MSQRDADVEKGGSAPARKGFWSNYFRTGQGLTFAIVALFVLYFTFYDEFDKLTRTGRIDLVDADKCPESPPAPAAALEADSCVCPDPAPLIAAVEDAVSAADAVPPADPVEILKEDEQFMAEEVTYSVVDPAEGDVYSGQKLPPRVLHRALEAGSNPRLRRFLRKLQALQPVKVAAIGGSVIADGGCYGPGCAESEIYTPMVCKPAADDCRNVFLTRFMQWIQEYWPNDGHALYNSGRALGKRSGEFAYSCFDEIVPDDIDLVIIELNVEEPRVKVIEHIARRALEMPGAPAVVFLSNYQWVRGLNGDAVKVENAPGILQHDMDAPEDADPKMGRVYSGLQSSRLRDDDSALGTEFLAKYYDASAVSMHSALLAEVMKMSPGFWPVYSWTDDGMHASTAMPGTNPKVKHDPYAYYGWMGLMLKHLVQSSLSELLRFPDRFVADNDDAAAARPLSDPAFGRIPYAMKGMLCSDFKNQTLQEIQAFVNKMDGSKTIGVDDVEMVDGKPVPRESAAAPAPEAGTVTQMAVPISEEPVPAAGEMAPAAEEMAPATEETAPATEEVAPATEEDMAPADGDMAPAAEDMAPADGDVAPAGEDMAGAGGDGAGSAAPYVASPEIEELVKLLEREGELADVETRLEGFIESDLQAEGAGEGAEARGVSAAELAEARHVLNSTDPAKVQEIAHFVTDLESKHDEIEQFVRDLEAGLLLGNGTAAGDAAVAPAAKSKEDLDALWAETQKTVETQVGARHPIQLAANEGEHTVAEEVKEVYNRCQRNNAVSVFTCNARYLDMCKLTVANLVSQGMGYVAVVGSDDICSQLSEEGCCIVDGWDEEAPILNRKSADFWYCLRWKYVEIALTLGMDAIVQDCDVLWTSNPLEALRADPNVVITGLRETGTFYPFNAGLEFLRASEGGRAVAREVLRRVKFFADASQDHTILEQAGIHFNCANPDEYSTLWFDQGIYNDILESFALRQELYTRSRMRCDPDGRLGDFNEYIKTDGRPFWKTGCLVLNEAGERACVAPDRVGTTMASWMFGSKEVKGMSVPWNMTKPVAMGYHFVGIVASPAEKIEMMKKVLASRRRLQ